MANSKRVNNSCGVNKGMEASIQLAKTSKKENNPIIILQRYFKHFEFICKNFMFWLANLQDRILGIFIINNLRYQINLINLITENTKLN